ncbi:hypothetical protein LXL04_017475 [Taraxacum kok-saghyz]
MKFGIEGNAQKPNILNQVAKYTSLRDKDTSLRKNLVSLGGKLKVGTFNNGINGACFLTKSTVDTLCHGTREREREDGSNENNLLKRERENKSRPLIFHAEKYLI